MSDDKLSTAKIMFQLGHFSPPCLSQNCQPVRQHDSVRLTPSFHSS